MIKEADPSLAVLVVEDVAETRDGIERLLKADGYRVAVARDERDAIESAQLKRPHLILVSLAGLPSDVILTARRIREGAERLAGVALAALGLVLLVEKLR